MSTLSTFPTVLRQLLRTHQAFLSYAAKHVHPLDLTLPQYDVIITLGNTPGMQPKKLGEETLITKGTLTGVVSRLEDKGLVERLASKKDGRRQIIRLTEAGRAIYEQTFLEHLQFINRLFDDYAPEEVTMLEADLVRLQQAVIKARGDGVEEPVHELLGEGV
jgi:DNA-binding MarR family transcriptional regulator